VTQEKDNTMDTVTRTEKHLTITYHRYLSDEHHRGGHAVVVIEHDERCPLCREEASGTNEELRCP
jgi:hypothetical protein